MATASLPPAAAAANANTLADALAAASITDSPSASEPKESSGSDKPKEDLEEGEIRDEEEVEGKVKTVFDDADKFNVKVGSA